MERIFVGWEKSIVESAAAWLWQRRAELATMCIVVPTSQAGRKLRDQLGDVARQQRKGLFGLRIVTPSFFLKRDDVAVAGEEVEVLAWMEVLEQITDWETYRAAFPQDPGESEEPGWSLALAQSLYSLRRHLQDAGLRIKDAAKRLIHHLDAGRWEALSQLEDRVEKKLYAWNFQSRSHLLRSIHIAQKSPILPEGCQQLVVVGVTDAPSLVTHLWQRLERATILIAAPESAQAEFDEVGRPSTRWNERIQHYPGREGIRGSVSICSEPRQLGEHAVAIVAGSSLPSDQVMLSTCDPLLGEPLVKSFARAGWQVYNPAASSVAQNWRIWLRHWLRWLASPQLATVSDITGFPETSALTGLDPITWAPALGKLRDQWLVQLPEDVTRIAKLSHTHRIEGISEIITALHHLNDWRQRFLQEGFAPAMIALANEWHMREVIDLETRDMLHDQAQRWKKIHPQVRRDASFWLSLFLETLPAAEATIPQDRVLDVEGWLEIPFNNSPLLLLCGMNDQVIPARGGGEPWLAEGSKKLLGITTDEQRAARDAYLYYTIVESRREQGSIHIICTKTDSTGKILHPSRLLLQAQGRELAERVTDVFQGIEPSDSQLVWEADWKWTPRAVDDARKSLSITSLRDYLMCPYRFYLKHRLRMNAHDGGRGEWNQRDFGTVMHEILERWGKDEHARDLADANELTAWLHASLDVLIQEWYGMRPNLALQIQSAALRQRFAWFAEEQALHRQHGWRIIDVEKAFELELSGITLRGKIDRIDQHESTGESILWDYKSGKLSGKVSEQHCKAKQSRTRIPAHLGDDTRLFFFSSENKEMMWYNLQLPLYAAAGLTNDFPGVGYIAMGDAREQISFDRWQDFDPSLAESAKACAQLIVERIQSGIFWPPAEKSKYDDFPLLAAGSDLMTMTEPTHVTTR